MALLVGRARTDWDRLGAGGPRGAPSLLLSLCLGPPAVPAPPVVLGPPVPGPPAVVTIAATAAPARLNTGENGLI